MPVPWQDTLPFTPVIIISMFRRLRFVGEVVHIVVVGYITNNNCLAFDFQSFVFLMKKSFKLKKKRSYLLKYNSNIQ